MGGQAVTRRSFLGTTAGALTAVSAPTTVHERPQGARAPARSLVVDMAVDAVTPAAPAAELSRFLETARRGGLGVAVTTVVGDEDWPAAMERIEGFTPLLEKFNLAHCRSVDDIEAADRAGRTAVVYRTSGAYWLVTPHGGYPMTSLFKPQRFATLRRLGVRVVQLTDDYKGLLGDGCAERTDCGLTDYGVWAVRSMDDEGLVIDCAHAGYRTSMEVIEASRHPVIFGSSNVRSLAAHDRNLLDDQIKAVAAKGGAVGVSAVADLVGDADVSRLVDHVDHIARLVGIEHVMLGLGYGLAPQPGSAARALPKYALSDHAELPALRERLRTRRYGGDAVEKIMGGNALRVFRTVWKS